MHVLRWHTSRVVCLFALQCDGIVFDNIGKTGTEIYIQQVVQACFCTALFHSTERAAPEIVLGGGWMAIHFRQPLLQDNTLLTLASLARCRLSSILVHSTSTSSMSPFNVMMSSAWRSAPHCSKYQKHEEHEAGDLWLQWECTLFI